MHREERAAEIDGNRPRELRRLVGADRPDRRDDSGSADEAEELVEVGGIAPPGVVVCDVERTPAVTFAGKCAARLFERSGAARDEHQTRAALGERTSRCETDPHRAAREQDTPACEAAHA